MAYNITLTNGTNLVTVADGTIVTDYTSLTLVGKNFAGYGSFLNENFVKLIENFANSTEPPNALQGQIWWDTTNKVLKVRNGAVWKTVSSSSASPAAPVGPTVGDLWWDTVNGQLDVWSGSQWVVIGPSYTSIQKKTGAIADSVTEAGGSGVKHIVVKFYVNDVLVAILSKDPSFTATGLTGFSIINPGVTLSTASNYGYYGDADNALNLGGVAATNFLRKDTAAETMVGRLHVQNTDGVTVGPLNEFSVKVGVDAGNPLIKNVNLLSNGTSNNLNLWTNIGGVAQKMLSISGTAGQGITVSGDPTLPLGIATKQYVDTQLTGNVLRRDGTNTITGTIYPDANNVLDLGTLTNQFHAMYATTFEGTATNATHLGGIIATDYARTNDTSIFLYPISIKNDGGLTIGALDDFTIDVTSSPNTVNLRGNTAGKGIIVSVKDSGGAQTNAITIDGATGLATVVADPVANLGIATKQYVATQISNVTSGIVNLTNVTSSMIPAVDLTYAIGSSTKRWTDVWATTFHGNANTANYADLAERFAADAVYAPGTVVELGGDKEITLCTEELSESVFGVISSAPAYLMNDASGGNDTHPPVALQGRVPVSVVGTVKKGDRLVSAGNGKARAALRSEITPYNVIGRSLVNKDTAGEGTIEAIVKLNS